MSFWIWQAELKELIFLYLCIKYFLKLPIYILQANNKKLLLKKMCFKWSVRPGKSTKIKSIAAWKLQTYSRRKLLWQW